MKLSEKQEWTFNRYAKRDIKHLCLYGAVGTGKTKLLVLLFVLEVMRCKGKNYQYIIGGASKSTIERNFLVDMREITGLALKLNKDGAFKLFGNMVYTFEGKNKDAFKKLRGMNSAGSLLGELTTLDKGFYDEVCDRTRAGAEPFILSDTNPDHTQHWVKREIIDKHGQKFPNGKTEIYCKQFVLDDNPFVSDEYKWGLKSRYKIGSALYLRKIQGEFTDENEASIYGAYMDDMKYLEDVNVTNLYVALDLGIADGTVLTFGVKVASDKLAVINHYYNKGKPTDHYIQYIKDYCQNIGFPYQNVNVILPHDSAKREDGMSTIESRYNHYCKNFRKVFKIRAVKQIDMINNTRNKLKNFLTNESKVLFLKGDNMEQYINKIRAYSWRIENGVINETVAEHGISSDAPSNYADSLEYLVYYTLGFDDVEQLDKTYYKTETQWTTTGSVGY